MKKKKATAGSAVVLKLDTKIPEVPISAPFNKKEESIYYENREY